MGKIKKQFSTEKHGSTLSPYVANFIREAETLPLYQLRSHLQSFPWRWPFPRGDLYHWIPLLNRFDDILEQFCQIYALNKGIQTRPFAREQLLSNRPNPPKAPQQDEEITNDSLDLYDFPEDGDRELIESIVQFSRLLHENCGNRSLYASSGRLNDLLNSSSLSLVEVTLRLAHRLAARYAAQRLRSGGSHANHLGSIKQDLLNATYSIDLDKIVELARPTVRAASFDSKARSALLEGDEEPEASDAADTQTKYDLALDAAWKSTAFSGCKQLKPVEHYYGFVRELATQLSDGQSDRAATYRQFVEVTKVWAIHASTEARHLTVSIRLLAMANAAQIYPESALTEKLLSFYADLPRHQQLPQVIVELVRPPSGRASMVPRKLQTLGLATLSSFAPHKNLNVETVTALNLSVNHGPFMSTMRQGVNMVTESPDEDYSNEDTEWIKELFDALHHIPKATPRGGMDGLVSAGLMDLLVEILKSRTLRAERIHDNVLRILTVYIWNISDALSSMVTAGGLDVIADVLVGHISRAVKLTKEGKGMPSEFKTQVTDFRIPFTHQQALKGTFKFMSNMLGMAGAGFDRLMRNLLESSEVLSSLRTVISNPRVFGSQVWTGSLHIFSGFINNEPTSYAAIAEAGIPRAILESIVEKPLAQEKQDTKEGDEGSMEEVTAVASDLSDDASPAHSTGPAGGIPAACEAVNAIPDAFGAMCLNEAGRELFEKSEALDKLFGVFVSPTHIKAFGTAPSTDIDRLGGTIEQLHRHHPTLSSKIKDLVVDTAARVATLVAAAPGSEAALDGSRSAQRKSEDVEMRDPASSPQSDKQPSPTGSISPSVSTYVVAVFTKFLSSLFRNTSFCTRFADRGGLDSLLQMVTAPALFRDTDLSKGVLSFTSIHRFAEVVRLMADQRPHIVLPTLIGRLQASVTEVSALTDYPADKSFMRPFTRFSSLADSLSESDEIETATSLRKLVHIKVLIESLAKSLNPSPPHHPTRAMPHNPLTQINVADLLCPLITSLGRLQKKLLWEQQLFGQAPERKTSVDGGADSHGDASHPHTDTSRVSNPDQAASTLTASDPVSSKSDTLSRDEGLRYVASNYQFVLPSAIAELFAKISNTIVPRRVSPDGYQRQQVLEVGGVIAQTVIDLLAFELPSNTSEATGLAFRKSVLECVKGPLLGQQAFPPNPRSAPQFQTLVVLPFMKRGGFEWLSQHAQHSMVLFIRPRADDEEETKYNRRRDNATTSLMRCMSLFGGLCDKRYVTESVQTTTLGRSGDRNAGRSDMFNPGQLLVELRLKVVRAILPIWNSDDLGALSSLVIRHLSKVIQSLLEGSSEGGAYHNEDMIEPPKDPERRTWQPRNEQVNSLTESGYTKSLAQEALYRCSDSEASAREYCSYFERRRFPPPSNIVTQPPPPPPPTASPASAGDGDSDVPNQSRDDEDMSSTPSYSIEDVLRGDAPGQGPAGEVAANALNGRSTALIDTLSDVANSILQDPSSAEYPAGPSSSRQPASDGVSKRVKVEDLGLVTIEELDEERGKIRDGLEERCLNLCGAFEDVTFEMSDLITASVSKSSDPLELRDQIIQTLVTSLVSYASNEDIRAESKKVTGIAHLIGLVLQDKQFFEAARETLKDCLASILDLLIVPQAQKPSEDAPWISQVLLIVERMLTEDIQPHQMNWSPPPMEDPFREQPKPQLPEPLVSPDDKAILFDKVIALLPRVNKDLELGISLVRVLVPLTRSRDLAVNLTQRGNMQKFLVSIKQLAPVMTDRFRNAVMMILRHINEDEETVRQQMRSDIKEMLSRPSRPVDTTRLCKELYHDVLRAPEMFVEVVSELCEISKLDRSISLAGPQNITLKKSAEMTAPVDAPVPPTSDAASGPNDVQPSAEKPDTEDKPKPQEIKPPVVEHPAGVVHFLLSELLAYKEVEDTKPAPPEQSAQQNGDVEMTTEASATDPSIPASQSQQAPKSTEKSKEQFKADEHPIFVYRCFILQALSEILASYNRTKVEFINFSRKADPQAATPSKPRSGVLNYLLNDVLPTGSIQHASDLTAKKKGQTSHCAIGLITALCSRTTENGGPKHRDSNKDAEDEPELAFVRRFVLEHALKAYKDCMASSEPIEARYSKLLALADLFNRMLAGRPAPHPGLRHSHADEHNLEPSNKQIAKMMFEKNFSGALTSSLSDIDPKQDGVNRLIKYILRPLKLLTHTAIELSLAGDPSTSPGTTSSEEDEISSATSVSEAGHEREETPDLYRNSALGMFERGEDDGQSSEDEGDEDEEAMYEDGYDEGMEYEGEEEHDEGDVVSDEDEEMEAVGHMEGLDGDVGLNVEIELEDGGSGSDDDEDDEAGEEDSDDEMEEHEADDEVDDEEEGDDEEIEILDEVTGDDEGDSLGDGPEDEGDDEMPNDFQPRFGRLGEELPFVTEEEGSDSGGLGGPGISAPVLDLAGGIGGGIDIDPGEDAIDLESGGDEDEEEDEGEEDYEDEILYRETEEDEPGQIFNAWPSTPGRRSHGIRAGGMPGFDFDPDPDAMFDPSYRGGRPTGGRLAEPTDGQNPLLNRARRPTQAGPPRPPGATGGLNLPPGFPPLAQLLPRLEDLQGTTEPEYYEHLNQLFSLIGRGGPGGMLGGAHHAHRHHGAAPVSVRMATGLGGGGDMIEIAVPHGHSFTGVPHTHSQSAPANDPAQAVAFQPTLTAERWQEEARLVFGPSHVEKPLRVINAIHQQLVPPAMEADNQRKKKAEEDAKKREEERQREEAERKEREEKERKEREEREAKEKEEAEAAAAAARANELDAPTEGQEPTAESMEGVESTADQQAGVPANEAANNAEASRERVMTTIRGSPLDITDLGIDATYLEALPEEMREEVIMQQYAEHRSQAAAAGNAPGNMDTEFLQALPEDIREEIMAQERHERRRRERQEARRQQNAAAGQPAHAEDMDAANFVASLDPGLRAQVLADADDSLLANLPPDMVAEARALTGPRRGGLHAGGPGGILGRLAEQFSTSNGRRQRPGEANEPQRQRRPIVQMLDKASVITLLRLMFIPIQGHGWQALSGILRNASANHQTRSEVVSGLLQILQDGSADQAAVEKSFQSMASRAKQSNVSKTPTKKPQGAEVHMHSEATPRLVMSNCLASLVFLTQSIPHIPKFFLTEHEVVSSSKSKGRGKGKARDTKASRIPLNALLSLLDREMVTGDSQVIERLAGLLQSVTAPLVQLLKKEKLDVAKAAQEQPSVAASSDASAPTEAAGQQTSTQPTTVSTTDGTQQSSGGTEQAAVQDTEAKTDEAKKDETKPVTEPKKPFEPPEIPEENLRLIINILTARECGAKTFRDALSTINNLSAIPSARETFGRELISRARQLAQAITQDLSKLIDDLHKTDDAIEAQNMTLSKFSPSGSDQSKLNRILTALDYLFDAKNLQDKDAAKQSGLLQSGTNILASLQEDSAFKKVWITLSQFLGAAHSILAKGQQSDKNFINVATILLPLIEALMVSSKRLDIREVRALNASQKAGAAASPAVDPSLKHVFFNFTNDHRKILNDLVRNNPKLMSGTFSPLVKNSAVLEFDNKQEYFNRRLHQRSADTRQYPHPSLSVNVRRDQVFTDSYRSLFFKKPEEMKFGKLNVRFHNEEGVDAGGVTREWFAVLSRQMFDANFALFNPVAADRTTFHPNPLSYINEEHLAYFQFIGRIIGKALYEKKVLDCHFSRAVYKQLLSRPVSLKDMETIDLEYSKSLQWMLDNDITDIITETFSVTVDNFGVEEIIDLVPNGRNIPVTEDNKQDYVRLVIEHKLTGSVRSQLDAFLKGFHDIVPAELVAIFDEGELELLISGLPDVDVQDWRNNTDYVSYTANSPQIQWFWRAVRSFGHEERAKLLQFITGTGKVPLNGFKELEGMNGITRFSIHKHFGDKDHLPTSHTCFNQLDLPEYDSYETLRKNLYTAMTTGGEYFGFA